MISTSGHLISRFPEVRFHRTRIFTVIFNEASNYNGVIAEIKFKVLANGGENISLGLTSDLSDIDYAEMTVENKPAAFTVKIPVTGISLDGAAERTLRKGAGENLTVKIMPANTTETDIKINWTSSNENVAKVDANGVVSAVGGGSAVITAKTLPGDFTAQVKINVEVPLTGFTIKSSANTNTVEERKTLTLSVAGAPADATAKITTVEWTSSDESVAKVNAGVVCCKPAGTGRLGMSQMQECQCLLCGNLPMRAGQGRIRKLTLA